MSKYAYGWRRQQPDFRDWQFAHPPGLALPSWIDLRSGGGNPPIFDQLELGSCTANAAVGSVQMVMRKEKVPVLALSRLDCYWDERVIEGTTDTDAGATIRDSMKALAEGTCLEPIWPYGDGSTIASPPSGLAKATKYPLKSYLSVASVEAMKASLALGYTVCFGISVYDSFESDAAAATGMIPLPSASENYLGGHALCAVGYRDSEQRVIFRNSWGVSWGDKGYGYIPYAYLSNPNLASDFWTPRLF